MRFNTSELVHVAAFLGYAVFAALLAIRGARTWVTAALLTASVATAAWAGVSAFAELLGPYSWTIALAKLFRDASWFGLILAILYAAGHNNYVWRGLVTATTCVVIVDALFNLTGANAGSIAGLPLDARVANVATSVMGLILVENMMRNLSRDQVWAIKLLGIGLFTIVACELVLELPRFLIDTSADSLAAALPAIFLVVLPLFVMTAVRNPASALRLYSSRKVVFQTTALISVGVMLQGAAIAAYYVRVYGGDNATVLSIVVGFTSIVVILVAIGSASVRSRVRGYINENLFSYKFDYRLEWEKFIRALTVRDSSDIQLHVLRTLAELLDSPGGGLWILRERWQQYLPVANWSMGEPDLAPIAIDDPCLAEFNDGKRAYLELTGAQASASARVWRDVHPAAWLVVPLRYREKLIGVALIHRPRAERNLDWEDENLISLMAMQLAAYLVQEETIQALADARQLEEFNKRFAFILHDTKNAIGQLSLLVRNVEQFGHDEEFRKDMVLTLRHSVDKLQGLLAQLRGEAGAKATEVARPDRIDIAQLVDAFVGEKRKMGLNLVAGGDSVPAYARLSDERRFLGVLEHVTSNAIEAAPKGSPVSIRVGVSNGSVQVAVADKGPGMTQQFIANQLFRPLRSTKEHGFGIGAYQAREIMRDLDGNIEVRSKVGEGTTVALSLPVYVSEKEVARV